MQLPLPIRSSGVEFYTNNIKCKQLMLSIDINNTLILRSQFLNRLDSPFCAFLEKILLVEEKLSCKRRTHKSSHPQPFPGIRNRHKIVNIHPQSQHRNKKWIFIPWEFQVVVTFPCIFSDFI